MAKKITELAALSAPAGSDILPAVDISDATGDANGTTKRITLDQIVAFSGVASKLDASAYTASDVFSKVLTLDGSGSGLDADTVDGFHASVLLKSNAADTFTGSLTWGLSSGTMFRAGASSGDITLWRVDANTGATASGGHGFTVRYMGSRSGNENSFSIFADQETSGTQVEAFQIKQDGTLWTDGEEIWTGHNFDPASKADASHTHVIGDVTGLQTALDAKLAASAYTAADVRTKLLTVDGIGSGIDADMVDGSQAQEFSWGHFYGHGQFGDFNTFLNSNNFGAHFIQGTANGPGHSGATQYYHARWSLGAGYDNYSMQWAIPRNVADAYLYYRFEEGGSAGSWRKMRAGEADSLVTARTISLGGDLSGSASFDGSANVTITATVADDSHAHTIANVDGLQTALNGKADNATTLAGYGITNAYTKTETDAAISAVVDAAPGALDTLNELAAALGDDPNFSATITAQIASKANAVHTHSISDVSGLQGALDAKVDEGWSGNVTGDTLWLGGSWIKSSAASFQVNGFQRTGGIVLHPHTNDDIGQSVLTNGELYLENKSGNLTWDGDIVYHAGNFDPASKADASHTHIIGDVTGLQSALDAKAPLSDLPGYNQTRNIDSDDDGFWTSRIGTETDRGTRPNAYTFIVNFDSPGNGQGLQLAAPYSATETYYIRRRSDNNGAPSGANVWQPWATIWTNSNDGAGSGLDADLLDGYQSASGATANTIALRNGSGDLSMRYGFSTYLNMSHAQGTRSSDTVFYSSTDDYIRKNNATGFRNALNVPTRTGGDASGTWGISITGNAATATALATARNIALSGDVTGSANFDGTGNISITATVADDSHAHVIGNVDGLQTALDAKQATSEKGQANGYASLDGSGTVPLAQLPDIGGGISWSAVSVNTTMTAGSGYLVDASGATRDMTVPTTLAIGDVFQVHAIGGSARVLEGAHSIEFKGSNIGGDLLIADGETAHLVARTAGTAAKLEIV